MSLTKTVLHHTARALRYILCTLSRILRLVAPLSIALMAAPLAVEAQQAAQVGQGARIRVLDKQTGQTQDLDILNSGLADEGNLIIQVVQCRFPEGNPAGDAWAFLNISDHGTPVFSGWMVASSPALNALDNARYDVWVMRCLTDATPAGEGENVIERPEDILEEDADAPVD